MRPQRAMGRPGTPVIPAGWETSHGTVAAATMTATVNLRKPGGTKTWNTTTRRTEYTGASPYATAQPARIQAQTVRTVRSGQEEVAEETLQIAGYLVAIALDQEPAAGDLVDVTASSDPLLTGRTLRIHDVVRGSLRFERDLLCTLADPAET